MRHTIGHRGRPISYLEASAPGPGPGHVLLLLHAFPMSAEMWEPQLAAVRPGWRFVAPDLRGFGRSDAGDTRQAASVDDYAEDLLALLDALDIDRVAVAGLSMGGYAAFALLRRQPARVSALVLADTRAEADDETARTARDAMIETLAAGGAAAVFGKMQAGLLGETTRATRPDVVARVRAIALAQTPDGVRRGIERLKSRPDSRPLLAAIACPALVVAGEEDRITTPDVARDLQNRIAGARLSLIPKAGHLSNLENPEAFNSALGEFLDGARLAADHGHRSG
jgi:3-oxoadipate enol-lactonase